MKAKIKEFMVNQEHMLKAIKYLGEQIEGNTDKVTHKKDI